MIYLDHNATTPVAPEVLEAMLPWFTAKFGNAHSATHAFGWEAAEAVKIAREQVAALLGAATPEEILFTSGATEAINTVLRGVPDAFASKGRHLITCAAEHSAVLDTCQWLEKKGLAEVTCLPVDANGNLSLDELKAAFRPDTILVCLMAANNETGVVHPIGEIAAICRERNVLFFTDATQAIGKMAVSVEQSGIALLACSAHKFGGPKGVGALYVRRRDPRAAFSPLLTGGGHERGLRSGTLNVPGIVGMGAAAALRQKNLMQHSTEMLRLRNLLEAGLKEIPGVILHGANATRLPNTTMAGFAGVDGNQLIKALPALAVSHGSACTSALPKPSHVLTAMGVPETLALASVRFSLGFPTSEEEVREAVRQVGEALKRLRK
jgi:cysteine desulfurase